MRTMSDTDTTHIAPRPSALGDLRLAGTIATGLVAGTLGLGALAAPLVGWKDWTSGLERSAKVAQVKMASPNSVAPAGSKSNIKSGEGNTGTGTGTGGAAPVPSISVSAGGGVLGSGPVGGGGGS